MDTTHKEMQSFSARLRTFETAQPIRKRQATGQSKRKTPSAAEWPLKKPDPVLLARAGFFYRPDQESFDNVTCFLCNVRLDGWEETDVPIQEHLAHTRGCPWATAVSVFRGEEDAEAESRDPLAEDMLVARKATFATGEGWPHEGKKGWKCKIAKMVEAGWCWDPSAEEGDGVDGVTCFYCGLSLDGWEPKDDPFTEHKRREPACRYFELLEHFHGADAANGKIKKTKSASKGARASTASKASRMSRTSVMSAITAMSDVPSMPGSYVDPLEDVDDSNVTTATTASQATATSTTKGKKKGGRTKAAAKGAKGRKKTAEEPMEDIGYPVLEEAPIDQQVDGEAQAVPSKKSKRGTRASKQVDSSVIEISQSEMVPPKKSARTARKAQKEPTPEAEQLQQNASTAAAWVEMQNDFEADDFEPGDQSTPAAEPRQSKRGVKRSSDGSRKHEILESSAFEVHVDAEAEPEPAPKRKRGRPKKTSASSVDVKAGVDTSEDVSAQQDSTEMDTTVAPATKGKGKAKAKKASSARSSRSSKAKADPIDVADEPEDLARDEMEIEQELARIAAEQSSQQAVQEEQDQENEFEPSPSSGRISKDSAELQKLQDEVEADEQATQQDQSPRRQSYAPADVTPSPNGSDKENRDSSLIEPSAKQAQPAVVLSPTKTVKIPLAASTPNRSPRKAMLSPSKQISHLSSTKPWTAIDPDIALIPTHLSENAENVEPGQLSELLLDAAGDLTSPEKKMTVEEWIRYRAEKSEQDLRRRCELMVSAFEKEGMRALESVHGIHTVE